MSPFKAVCTTCKQNFDAETKREIAKNLITHANNRCELSKEAELCNDFAVTEFDCEGNKVRDTTNVEESNGILRGVWVKETWYEGSNYGKER
ncbi:hypothetical protein ACFL15_00485 [Patescibacteria group bacterium]